MRTDLFYVAAALAACSSHYEGTQHQGAVDPVGGGSPSSGGAPSSDEAPHAPTMPKPAASVPGNVGSGGSITRIDPPDAAVTPRPDAGTDATVKGSGGSRGSGGASGTAGAGDPGGSGGTSDNTGTLVPPNTLCAHTNVPSTCGNGTIDPGELCDGRELGGVRCQDIDPRYTGGKLECGSDCLFYDASCIHDSKCGNGIVDPGEDCDPQSADSGVVRLCNDFPPHTSAGFGRVECHATTCRWDFEGCDGEPPPVCGNGIVEAGEECDGKDRWVMACTDLYYVGGVLGCRPDCRLDVARCLECDSTRCGDGVAEGRQACDGSDFKGTTCQSFGFQSGSLVCSNTCTIDSSGCRGCVPTRAGPHCQ